MAQTEFAVEQEDEMKRRTFLQRSVVGVGGLAGISQAGLMGGAAVNNAAAESANVHSGVVGRPVRVTSISFKNGALSLDEIVSYVDKAGAAHVDVIAVPETCRGQQEGTEEGLNGPTITAMSALAKKHNTYMVVPIDRRDGKLRLNTAVLLDRNGKVVAMYNKVFPYWSEYDVHPAVDVGEEAPVYQADFGKIGMAICFDANFPEVWKRLADQGAELVIWPSAYSAGSSLQAHAINNHYYIVTATQTRDCLVYDINGEKIHYSHSDHVNVATVTLDLDRGIYHQNFNMDGRKKLLAERAADVHEEKWMELEQWFIIKSNRPGVSARQLAKQYGMEELRDYLNRSRHGIDAKRGFDFEAKVIYPDMDRARLTSLSHHGDMAGLNRKSS
jgi:predicted amidohydrolase